jgi:predicted ATPase
MLDRLVTQIEPQPAHLEELEPRAFCDFSDYHTIILLGDPGLGKTHLFEHAAEYERAVYKTVREFVLSGGEGCEGKTVYLDALDEFRSRSGDKNLVAKIVRIVRDLDRPKIRLSCRAADWLGNTDLTIFRRLAQSTNAHHASGRRRGRCLAQDEKGTL